MTGLRAGALAGVVLGAWACAGGPSNENSLPMPNGGAPGHMASGTVMISIETPAADPRLHVAPGGLIAMRAHLSVVDGSDYIDANSIHVTLTAQGSGQAIETGQLVLESGDSYTGRISVGDLKSGTYTLTVTARSSGGALGEATVDFLIDSSPVLVINSPTEGGSYKRTLTIDVIASDPVGLMGPPTATVGDIPVPLGDAGAPDNYRGTIDFDAQLPPLFGDQLLTVTVINNDGQKAEAQAIFTIDNDGPLITSTVPIPGQMTGGIILLAANISDPAGIIDSSVVALIGDDPSTPLFELPLKPRGAGVYGTLFDTARLTRCPNPPATGPCIVYPTISFRASDQVGNETIVGYEFAIDNIAPVADLDSLNVRFLRKDGYCSREFDPLSLNRHIGDMPNDKAVVPQVFDLRARVQDDGNAPAGIKEVPIAGLDPDATSVYILDDEAQPLVVDVDGDGTCDAINPNLIPTTQPPTVNNQVLKVRLAGVPKQGAPDYRADSNPSNLCGYDPMAMPPEFLCDTGQPYATMAYAHGRPAVWSVEPVGGAWCMGSQFDTRANNIAEGWACIAVQSADLSGNSSVSAPLRVYIRYEGAGAGAAAPPNLGAPPPCTGTYNKATGAVTNGTCTTRRFDRVDHCFDGNCPRPPKSASWNEGPRRIRIAGAASPARESGSVPRANRAAAAAIL